ncbi:MAG: hypothetical protein HZY76_10465 [Anaerolineae bacterium]|nr:MAG: hypothetical protein HZY76_10465 [Anaerolineae bacterium]
MTLGGLAADSGAPGLTATLAGGLILLSASLLAVAVVAQRRQTGVQRCKK